MQIKIFNSSAEFRGWLEKNHDRVAELWLGFYNKRTDKKSITYREALDEALCFGWIDGVRKSINKTTYKQRFTPRKAKSYWSAVNIRRVGGLAELGRVAPSGVKAFERRTSDSGKYSFESRQKKLAPAYAEQFKANRAAWEFFRAQAPWYQRTSTFWVVSAKQEETRQRRLATLIGDSEKGRRLGMLAPKAKNPQDPEGRSQVKQRRG
ncbi:MAG TPA: YdeI/OmpD-associated family protein [Candidatus Dormibacteraeota bacterium]|nr:YdeI/OmpD-associated family protein [Candidatus Dormibacteraeota bacterium]